MGAGAGERATKAFLLLKFFGDKQTVQSNAHGDARAVSIFQMPPQPSLFTCNSLLASGPIWALFVPWAGGEAFLHLEPQIALPGEAEAPGRAEEGLSTPVQLLVQSFGDGLSMTVGGGEFEHKGLPTPSTAPEKPSMLGISYSKNNSLLNLTSPPFTLK